MAADGLIVLGLDVSQTQANIQSELDGILNSAQTKKIILKTAIEKAETEKQIDSVVAKVNKKTVKMGIEIDAKSVNDILASQQKIASTQAKLNSQMQEYRKTAKEIGVTLNKDTWNAFNHAVSSGDFTKANDILKSAKTQIEEYRAAVQRMNSDTSVSGSVSSIVNQFSKLKDVSAETQKRINLLKANLAQFENADSTQAKLSAYKRLQTMIESLSDELRNLSSTEKAQSSDLSIKKKIDDARSSLKVFKTQYEDIGNSAAAQKVTAAIDALDTALKDVDSSASGGALAKQWDEVSAAINNAKRAVSEYNAEQRKFGDLTSISSDLAKMLNYQGLDIDDAEVITLKTQIQETIQQTDNLIQSLNNLDSIDDDALKGLSKEANLIREKFKELSAQTKVFSSGEEFEKFQTRCEKARVAIEEYDKKYSAIKSRPDLVRELDDLKQKSKHLNTEGQLDALINSYNRFNLKVQEAGLKTQSFGDKLKKAFANFSSFFTASRLIYEAISTIKKMISDISELDTAMVELRKVTDATDQEFDAFLGDATKKAVELGTTITDLVNATSDFSRLGFSLEDSEKLGQIATIYANVGDEVNSIDEATSSLISTLKGFGLETADASAVLDKFNEVGNRFAITSGGIGNALQRSASSMAAANNTIDETIALITAANTVVQDADVVGRVLPTLKMAISVKRLRRSRPRKDFISILIHTN